MKEEFLSWAAKKRIFSETEPNDEVMQWLWIAWQRAWNLAILSQKPTIEKLRMEKLAYENEYMNLMTHKFKTEYYIEEKL
jgi:hypothetical protein